MLGNWSLGDYWKRSEVVGLGVLTKSTKFPKRKTIVTILQEIMIANSRNQRKKFGWKQNLKKKFLDTPKIKIGGD